MDTLTKLISNFFPGSQIKNIQKITSGHIQKTWLVSLINKSEKNRFILQKINTKVFHNPKTLVENHTAIFNYLTASNQTPIIPRLEPDSAGNFLVRVDDNYWRILEYIKNSKTFDTVANENIAFEGGGMVGKFQTVLINLPTDKIKLTIEGFHSLPKYLKELDDMILLGQNNRAREVEEEIERVLVQKNKMLGKFEKISDLPDHICHNDTKISNILFDIDTKKAIKMIDLDTAMPGKIVYDFGDMVRSFVPSVNENSSDLDQLEFRLDIFESMASGYLSQTKGMLDKNERALLYDGALVLVYEQAIRFLWDYLNGDQYYSVAYPHQNKVRAKNQLKLLEELVHCEKKATLMILEIIKEPTQ